MFFDRVWRKTWAIMQTTAMLRPNAVLYMASAMPLESMRCLSAWERPCAAIDAKVLMRPDTVARLVSREAPKGEVLATARIAAILAAKRTHELIPLCHAVALTHLDVLLEIDAGSAAVHVTAVADAYDRTGCEMEAMVAVSTACLTVYDMLKGIDRDMVIADVKLIEKSGGRSGHYMRAELKP